MNLAEVKRWLEDQLSPVVSSQAQVTAERNLLLKHFLSIPVETLFTDPHRQIPINDAYQALTKCVKTRIEQRVPIQYLLGEAEFYGLTFMVSPHVLIPRPETELLVERAVAFCNSRPAHRVLDLGTGTGCIAISLKKTVPTLAVTATDISEKALHVARENAQRHQTPIAFLQGAWFTPVEGQRFDLIVSNPPYIPLTDRSTLTPEVLKEPKLALFPEGDPIALYHHLITGSKQHLTPGGGLLFEMGVGQGETIRTLAETHGFQTEILKDYSGIDRVLFGTLP